MPREVITNAESGFNVRTALNNMFAELYSSLVIPIKIPGINANASQALDANTFITRISISKTAGAPTVRIGTTPNGTEISDDFVVDTFYASDVNTWFAAASTIYFTVAGGTINIRIDILNNYY